MMTASLYLLISVKVFVLYEVFIGNYLLEVVNIILCVVSGFVEIFRM